MTTNADKSTIKEKNDTVDQVQLSAAEEFEVELNVNEITKI